jgi:hypothetical protein
LGGPPTHIHAYQDEVFICAEGRVTVELDYEERVMRYYKELSELPPGPRDMNKIAEIMTRHGLSLAPKTQE